MAKDWSESYFGDPLSSSEKERESSSPAFTETEGCNGLGAVIKYAESSCSAVYVEASAIELSLSHGDGRPDVDKDVDRGRSSRYSIMTA